MYKKILFLIVFSCAYIYPAQPQSDKARGMFVSFNAGPRVPIGVFSDRSNMGIGFNLSLDYTDNEYLPFFLFGKVGYEQFPGSQDFYQSSDYTHYSTNFVPFTLGARYYFAPILENFVIIMPCIEVGGNLAIYQTLHQYKLSSGIPSYNEDGTKFGYEVGVGVSMFLAEIMASYHYYPEHQFLSVDMRLRLPLYISL